MLDNMLIEMPHSHAIAAYAALLDLFLHPPVVMRQGVFKIKHSLGSLEGTMILEPDLSVWQGAMEEVAANVTKTINATPRMPVLHQPGMAGGGDGAGGLTTDSGPVTARKGSPRRPDGSGELVRKSTDFQELWTLIHNKGAVDFQAAREYSTDYESYRPAFDYCNSFDAEQYVFVDLKRRRGREGGSLGRENGVRGCE
jgi:hypothetical protein